MIHTEDLAELFLNAFECDSCEGRYFGVYESLHWKDIYKECERQIPGMIKPKYPDTKSAGPTGFDFARRDSLGVKLRDFPTMLSQTLDSLSFKSLNYSKFDILIVTSDFPALIYYSWIWGG